MNSMMQIGITLVAFDKMSRVIGDACGKATQQFGQLQEKIKQTSEKLAEIGTISYVGGQQMLNAMQKPIAAFMELEDASTQLKSTLMQDGGEIPKVFQAIDKEAMELGNKLPGTTADFYKMASSLKALGVSGEAIAGGVLKSAAYLGVVLKPLGVTYEQAAEYAAKFKEAMGVAEKDMVSFMDVIQRTAHTGVKIEEMKYAFSKVSGTLKPLGIQGLEASKEIAPLVGMLIKMGRSGEEVGSGIGQVINAVLDVEKVSKVNSMVSQFGVSLDFVDQKTGKFKGVANMIAQFDKLKGLSDVQKTAAFKELLGSGGDAALAKIISSEGVEGYNKQIDAMLKQADLNRRVELSLSTLKNMWEAFIGTLQNTFAVIGESAAPTLKRFTDLLNTLSGKLGDFAKNHATLTKIITLGGLIVGGSLVAFGALGIALSMILRVSSLAAGGIMKFTGFVKTAIPWVRLKTLEIWRLIGMQKLMNYISYHGGFWKAMQYWLMTTRYKILEAGGAMKFLTGGLRSVILSVRALSIAFLTSPIGWISLAIAGVALLIYKFWGPVSGFFRGLFKGIAEALKPLEPAWNIFKSIAPIFFPILIPLKLIYNLIKWLIKPVNDTGKAAENLGLRFGRVIGNILSSILTLPAKMLTAGAKIIESLWKGMMSFINKPVELIKNLAQKMRAFLPFSPAKEGPFKDLHKIRIIETIAETIRPAPMLTAMGRVMSATRQAILPSVGIQGFKGSRIQGGGIGSVTVNYNPTVNINGASPQAKEDFATMLKQHQHELLKLIQDAQAKNMRLAY